MPHYANTVVCKKCNPISKGERLIAEYLIENNIDFIREYWFKDLKDIRPLRYDFYLPKKNILIEFDGEQRFRKLPSLTKI